MLELERHFSKVFVLAAASYFEKEVYRIIEEYFRKATNDNDKIISFLKNQALAGRYHTFFNWGEKNNPTKPGKSGNKFYSLFGEGFKLRINALINGDEEKGKSVTCFIEVGHIRNILVHSDFASYNNIPKTFEEFYDTYRNAHGFLEIIKKCLDEKEVH